MRPMANRRTPTGSAKQIGARIAERPWFFSLIEASCELAVKVSTELVVPVGETVIELGSKAHEIRPVELEHEKFTLPLNPLTGVVLTVKFAELPAFTLALVGLTDPVKSQTCNCAVAVCVSGALTPVTAH